MSTDVLAKKMLERIFSHNYHNIFSTQKAELLIGDKVYSINRLLFNRRSNDYVGKMGEILIVGIQISEATYDQVIVPNRNALGMRIETKFTNANGKALVNMKPLVEEFDAFLTESLNMDIISVVDSDKYPVSIDPPEIVTVTLQLVDKNVSLLRLVKVAGTYPKVTIASFLETALAYNIQANGSASTLAKKDYKGIRGVGIIPLTNKKTYDPLVIPSDITLGKLVNYLQNLSGYGMYSSGANAYFTKGYWYVYPLFDPTRFSKTAKTLTILVITEEASPNVDKTFIVENEKVTIVAKGQVKHMDIGESILQNDGDSLSFQTASVMDEMVTAENNKATGNREKANSQFAVTDRKRGLYKTKTTALPFTDNPFKEMSNQVLGTGQLMAVTWDFCEPTLLYPGMPTQIYCQKNNEMVLLEGTLLGYESLTSTASARITDTQMSTVARLSIFCKPKEK